MRITSKIVKEMLAVLDELREEIKKEEKKLYPYAEWERNRKKVKEKLRKLPEYVEKAASMIEVEKRTGRPKTGTLAQRTMLFLFAKMRTKATEMSKNCLNYSVPFLTYL